VPRPLIKQNCCEGVTFTEVVLRGAARKHDNTHYSTYSLRYTAAADVTRALAGIHFVDVSGSQITPQLRLFVELT
jgi:hypothetical protein